MKDRIRKIMESQHMTQQVFAQFIEMSPASLSSIFNDRTKPTLNIVEAIKKKIPNISTDWLMFGVGDMYLSPTPVASATDEAALPPSSTIPSGTRPTDLMLDFGTPYSPGVDSARRTASPGNSVSATPKELVREEIKYVDKPQRRVIEIRVFYDDQTWDTFVPTKK